MIRSLSLLSFIICFANALEGATQAKFLKDYVNAFDKSTKLVKTDLIANKDGYKLYHISFNSLKWLDNKRVAQAVWTHNILIMVPDHVTSKTCFYRVSNGTRHEKIPDKIHPLVHHVSLKNNAIGIEIRNIPNQPIKFTDHQKPLVEDGIIAYAWDKFLKTGNTDFIPRLPMLKAAYLGFRAAKKFLYQKNIKVDEYIAFGESKRGWVVWLLPVVDPKVKAILPAVIDVLNVQKSMLHHNLVYEGWSPVLKDYENFNIPNRIFGKEFSDLMNYIDPYKYIKQISVPKLIINAGNDQFFLPDNSQFYFNDLTGNKHLMMLPNAGHQFKLNKSQMDSIATYFALIDRKKPLPGLTWAKKGSSLRIKSSPPPSRIKIWEAANQKARDFRYWDKNSPRYLAKDVATKPKKESYEIVMTPNTKGQFTSTFIEVHYNLKEGPLTFTTEAFVQ